MSDIRKKVDALVRPEIRSLSAYHVPDASGLVKLDAMENPYAWPAELKAGWLDALGRVPVNRYPDPGARALKEQLRSALGVPEGAGLLLGNGSDELIQILLLALARPGACALAPEPTFVMYRMIATLVGMPFVGVPLREDFALDRAAMRKAIAAHRPAVVFLAYPNNPTGNLFDRADVEAVLAESPGLVVVDEAYHAFAGDSLMAGLGSSDRLLVMRTLSKQGLAGLRLGVLAGPGAWLEELDKVRLPYNINSLTQASAAFAVAHAAAFEAQCARIRADRERLYGELTKLAGVRAWPSRANFILFRVESRPADEVFARLRRAGVLVKNLNAAGGPLAGCLRVTVGTPEENDAFIAALKDAL
ncbi:histidinol-phosphate aminotransferase [Sulfurifustis variabilis]|uniref:Histidinol-phosphate aminotransferase n=1 Tax=Sulfurifustis variabilis TaxID=1675686 RepID=A0A1B4VAU1_9GAMM|nr:histidinol-phosphate transaminase [Sulfurifustis variabilis]BAU47241.1 histidinol-phosphate aminotransferase [Sulfurifustis variabilis]